MEGKRTDFELLDAWRAGDRDAGNALVERHFLSMYGFFRNKVAGEIDDLIQKTFLACVESRDRFRKESSFRTYLYAVARNALHGYFRGQGRVGEINFEVQSVEDLGTSPSQFMARKREHRLLLQAMRLIPLDYQIALELFYWERLKGPEIAEVLGVPEGTVRTRIRRARLELAQRMAELAGSEEVAQSTVDNLERWSESMRELLQAEGRDLPE